MLRAPVDKTALLDGADASPCALVGQVVSRRNVAIKLVATTLLAYASLSSLVIFALPSAAGHGLGEIERQATLIAATMHACSLLLDVFSKQQLGNGWLQISISTVKLVATVTNFLLFSMDTPFILDPVTGRPNCMLRWVEWTVLAFTMTFLVEAIDATDARQPMLTGGSQGLSTFCGLLMPLCPAALPGRVPSLWCCAFVSSFALFFVIFWRLHVKETKLAVARHTLPARHSAPIERVRTHPPCVLSLARSLGRLASPRPLSQARNLERRQAEVGVVLMRRCVATWTALVLIWVSDFACRLCFGAPSTDWAYIADCAIDVVAKTLYATAIQERADAEPIRHGEQRIRIAEVRTRRARSHTAALSFTAHLRPCLSFTGAHAHPLVGCVRCPHREPAPHGP